MVARASVYGRLSLPDNVDGSQSTTEMGPPGRDGGGFTDPLWADAHREDVFNRSERDRDQSKSGVGGVGTLGSVDDETDPPIQSLVSGVVHSESHRRVQNRPGDAWSASPVISSSEPMSSSSSIASLNGSST